MTPPRPTRLSGRWVLKIGSALLNRSADAGPENQSNADPFARIAGQVRGLMHADAWPYIVSSGAISAGLSALRTPRRPESMPQLQAAAALGQPFLMQAWREAWGDAQRVAQVLLTHADLAHRARFLNARHALGALERHRVVAIINENDSVAFEEIAFGDNDQLAAMVANVVEAEWLILLTSVEGLLDGRGQRVANAPASDAALDDLVRPTKTTEGTGGMATKLLAARAACARGAQVAILDGRVPDILPRFFRGEDVGTVLYPDAATNRLSSRAHWILHTLRPAGELWVDLGAYRALVDDGRSLLPSGIRSVRGRFEAGDAVDLVVERDGKPVAFARGLSRYGADDLAKIQGGTSADIPKRLGYHRGDVAVHRSDLVLMPAARLLHADKKEPPP